MAIPVSKMGVDQPDYGVSLTGGPIRYVTDIAELAARLGSPNYFHRGGVQFFSENFDYGIQDWELTEDGIPAYVRSTAKYVSHGPYGVEMENNGGIGEDAYIERLLPYPYLATVGFEFHIRHISPGERFFFALGFYTGTHVHAPQIRIDAWNDEIELRTGPADFPAIDISPYHDGAVSLFHAIKFSVNLSTDYYVRLSIDGIEYDVTDYPIYYYAFPSQPRIWVYTGLGGSGGRADHIALDNILMTIEEPT